MDQAIVTLGAVALGGLISFLTSAINDKRQYRINRLQRQEQAYSQLYGLKFMTDQLYLTTSDIFSESALIEALERLELPSRSALGNSQEKRRKYDELALELARNNQRLWETIGLIRVLFTPSEEQERLIKLFELSMKEFQKNIGSIADYYEKATIENVDAPPDTARIGIKRIIHEYVDIPFEALQKHLEDMINAEKTRAKSWWQFWRRD